LSTPCVPLRLVFFLLPFFFIALPAMPAAKTPRASRHHTAQGFGELLTQARKAAGYTQQELADALGISRRMVVYYESQTAPPLAVFVASVVKVLGVSADVLMGCEAGPAAAAPANAKLARRLVALESLPAATQRQALDMLDALIEREHLKQAQKD
jgi:transcriptional regulator with XRE-family HTH domain